MEIETRKSRAAIGHIILNRPEAHNTFTSSLARALNDALLAYEEDETVRVVLITAEGRNFSYGISLDEFRNKTPAEYREFIRRMDEHNHTIARMAKPVIAAVQGTCAANGAGLAFACDFTLAASDARFGTTAVNVGLICLGPAGPMPATAGRKRTLDMVLRGRLMSAAEVLERGLITAVAQEGKLEDEAYALADELASKSPAAVQAGKRGVYAYYGDAYHAALDRMSDAFAQLAASEPAEAGVAAFLEKRSPPWNSVEGT